MASPGGNSLQGGADPQQQAALQQLLQQFQQGQGSSPNMQGPFGPPPTSAQVPGGGSQGFGGPAGGGASNPYAKFGQGSSGAQQFSQPGQGAAAGMAPAYGTNPIGNRKWSPYGAPQSGGGGGISPWNPGQQGPVPLPAGPTGGPYQPTQQPQPFSGNPTWSQAQTPGTAPAFGPGAQRPQRDYASQFMGKASTAPSATQPQKPAYDSRNPGTWSSYTPPGGSSS